MGGSEPLKIYGFSLLAQGQGGSDIFVTRGADIFWVCKTLLGIPLGTLFGA